MTALFKKFFPVGLALALAGIVLGGHLIVIDRYGSDVPEWDQWDAEGLHLLAPWFESTLTTKEVFLPHNEHRVVLTKLLGLAEISLNGQWDARLQCVVNATLHAALAAGLFLLGRGLLPARWHASAFLLIALLCALPLAWQNFLGGFHSQQYFLLGFSALAICVLPFAAALTRGWWLGAACAALALLSMGSGFLAAAIVLVALGWLVLRREVSLRAAWPALALCAVLVALGWFTRVEVFYHASLKAQNLRDFFVTAALSFRWPSPITLWAGALLWLPWLAVVGRALTGPATQRRDTLILAGLGGWVVLQVLASAWARGAGGAEPASRYMDTLAFGLIANGLALAWHCAHVPLARVASLARTALALAWVAVLAHGLADMVRHNTASDLPYVRDYHREAERRTRDYLATGDPAHLAAQSIPYPGGTSFRQRIDRPSLRGLMPVSIRPPLPLDTGRASGGFFRSTNEPVKNLIADATTPAAPAGISPATPPLAHRLTWGSFGAPGAATWESRALRAPHGGWLRFELAGHAGEPGTSLQLLDAGSRRVVADLAPAKTPGDSWRSVTVRAPSGPFIVAARVADSVRWLAFSAPVEMAGGSHFAWRLVRNGEWIAVLSALAAALLGFAAWLGRPRRH